MKRADRYGTIFWICSAAVIIILTAVFALSQQSGDESYKLSKTVLDGVKNAGLDVFTPEISLGKENASDGFSFILTGRKWAHIYLYALLGAAEFLWWSMLLRLKRERLPRRHLWSAALAFAFCLVCACADEAHQFLVLTRDGRPVDVLYDALGFSLSIVLTPALIWLEQVIRRRIHK